MQTQNIGELKRAVKEALANTEAARKAAQTLPQTGFVRLPQILAVIPVGRSTWWEWVKSGKAPAAVKLSERVTAWRAEDIHAFIQQLQAR